LREAFEQQAVALCNYMVELTNVEEKSEIEIEASGHDIQSLLYKFMDEVLYQFATESFLCKTVHIYWLDLDDFSIKSKCQGETFDRSKHTPGTEIKAITFSNMQIHDKEGRHDVYVIVDI